MAGGEGGFCSVNCSSWARQVPEFRDEPNPITRRVYDTCRRGGFYPLVASAFLLRVERKLTPTSLAAAFSDLFSEFSRVLRSSSAASLRERCSDKFCSCPVMPV